MSPCQAVGECVYVCVCVFFFRQIFVFVFFGDLKGLTYIDAKFPAEKIHFKSIRQRLGRGSEHACQISGSISNNRRGHVGSCAEKMCNLCNCLVIT